MEAWKRRVLKHRRRLYLLTAASMSPFSAMLFVGPQQDHCSSPQASSSFHVVFVMLPPSFVSPKLQVFNQRLIQNFLWMCPWIHYPTTPILCATQSTVRRNCPLCRRCFRNIPLQNTLPTIALQLTGCFPSGTDGFVWRFLYVESRPPSLSRSQKRSGHSSHTYVFLTPFQH